MNILLFDNGSVHLQKLKSLLQTYGTVKVTNKSSDLVSSSANSIVLSGGNHYSVVNHPDYYHQEIAYLKATAKPTLGICLGAEIIAYAFGATLEHLGRPVKGLKMVQVLKGNGIFKRTSSFQVYESHHWAITSLSANLDGLAKSPSGFEVIMHKHRPIYGFQFHPEMLPDKSFGTEIFNNLLTLLIGQVPTFPPSPIG